MAPFAASIRAAVPGLPVVAAGRIQRPQTRGRLTEAPGTQAPGVSEARSPEEAVESLRLVMGELQVADVRAQVALSLFTDFENFTAGRAW